MAMRAQVLGKHIGPSLEHSIQQLEDEEVRAGLAPLKPFIALLHDFRRVQANIWLQRQGSCRHKRGKDVIGATLEGAISDGHHGANGADQTGQHVWDWESRQYAGAIGMAKTSAGNKRASRRSVGHLLPAWALVHRAVRSVTILLDVDDALAPFPSHLQEVVEAHSSLGYDPWAVALDENVGTLDEAL